jgi:twitching motility protein PilT
MQTLNQSLSALYLRRLITLEEAIGHSSDPNELQQIIASGAGGSAAAKIGGSSGGASGGASGGTAAKA